MHASTGGWSQRANWTADWSEFFLLFNCYYSLNAVNVKVVTDYVKVTYTHITQFLTIHVTNLYRIFDHSTSLDSCGNGAQTFPNMSVRSNIKREKKDNINTYFLPPTFRVMISPKLISRKTRIINLSKLPHFLPPVFVYIVFKMAANFIQ